MNILLYRQLAGDFQAMKDMHLFIENQLRLMIDLILIMV